MIPTYNGCYRSTISCIPRNWRTKKASTKKDWVIAYRFYDPSVKGSALSWKKQVQIRGMNDTRDLEVRQQITAALIRQEEELLDVLGFNPITRQYMAPPDDVMYEISPRTPFVAALRIALDKVDVVHHTRTDMRSVVNNIEKASCVLYDNQNMKRYSDLAIGQVSRRHIKALLDYFSRNNPRWSNNRFNMYKAYISMLFKELLEAEACEVNPARDIAAKKKTRKLRAVLTPAEEQRIDEHLKRNHYTFWRFMRIFYDSQARVTELMALRRDGHVRINQQEFTVTVKKGKETREDIRVISADIIPLWREVWESAAPGQYLFSRGLKPGDKKIRPDQVGRRWEKYVKAPVEKGGLSIGKDFYSLKHLSTDKMASSYGLQLASSGAGHTNTHTTMTHYAVGEKRRRLQELKKKVVSFGS